MLRNLAIKQNSKLSQPLDWSEIGKVANDYAAAAAFSDYQNRKPINTLRRQKADLALFTKFLLLSGLEVGDLVNDPDAWKIVSWGLVAAFQDWQLGKGYAVRSVNVRLSTVKTYARLALKAGALTPEVYTMIRAVEGYSRNDAIEVDKKRAADEIETRTGAKKERFNVLSLEQITALKNRDTTKPQERRDALLFGLMLDLGLRVGEVAKLTRDNFNLEVGTLKFYRPKVKREQTHKLSNWLRIAAAAYLDNDAPAVGIIWRGSTKHGTLTDDRMTERAITAHVQRFGKTIGIKNLSAHDLRHTWVTWQVRSGTRLEVLQEAGGWSSLAMPVQYIEAAKIANDGVLF